MDWLRSEDLKEEKVVTASVVSVAASHGLAAIESRSGKFHGRQAASECA